MSDNVFDSMTPDQRKLWEVATDSAFIGFKNPVIVQFVDGNIRSVKNDGVVAYEFDTIQTLEDGRKVSKILGTRSKGLLDGLISHYPLTDKTFRITRTGEGYQTTYIVEEM